MNLEQRITDMLFDIGVPANLTGFRYLRTAIGLVFGDSGLAQKMTTKVYPATAAAHNTTPINVERNIRTAIGATYGRGSMEALRKFFGGCVILNGGTLRNGELIAGIAERLRMEDLQCG